MCPISSRTARDPGDPRTAEIAGNLARVRAQIADACAAAHRDPAEVTLVAVTKTYPAADVLRLAELGVTDIGENRDQEASAKAAEVAAAGASVRWHFVGRLQRNKCRSVARYATLVHSVDSVRLARALGAAVLGEAAPGEAALGEAAPGEAALGAAAPGETALGAAAPGETAVGAAAPGEAAPGQAAARPLEVLIQVSIDGDPARGGVPESGLAELAQAIAGQPALRLRGVMTVAPLDWDPLVAFTRLAALAQRLRADHPAATIISAGMTADLAPALASGATHVRIGAALLGKRDPLG